VGLPGAICRKGFFRECVKPAGVGVSLDGRVEPIRVERFEPGAETCQFPGRQLFDGSFDVFSGCHFDSITPEKHSGKARRL
jgi:hypothetical protein